MLGIRDKVRLWIEDNGIGIAAMPGTDLQTLRA